VTKCHRVTGLQVTVKWHHMTESHRNHRKVMYKPCSSCINSIKNLTETLSSFPCQLRLEEWLSCPGEVTTNEKHAIVLEEYCKIDFYMK